MNTLFIPKREANAQATVELFVCCLVDSEWQATNIVDRLRAGGFLRSEISVVFPHRSRSDSLDADIDLAAGVLDRRLGGFTAFHVPMLGLFLGAGPILAAFTDRAGLNLEELSVPLRTFGISQNRASRYAQRLGMGEILIAIHTSELNRAKRAEQIFVRSGGDDIGYSGSLIALSPPDELPPATPLPVTEDRPSLSRFIFGGSQPLPG